MKNFKKAIALLLSLLMLLPFYSCGNEKEPKPSAPDVHYDSVLFDIKKDCKAACFSDGKIFAAYDDGITVYSIKDGSSSELANGKYSAISAYEDKIYTVNEESGEIEIYLTDGTLFEKISLDDTDINEKLSNKDEYGNNAHTEGIASNGKAVYISVSVPEGNSLVYEYDIKAKSEKEFDFSAFIKGSCSSYSIKSISFCDDATVIFTYAEYSSPVSYSYAFAKYDTAKGEILDTSYVGDMFCSYYDKYDGNLYYCFLRQIKKSSMDKKGGTEEVFQLSESDCLGMTNEYIPSMVMLYHINNEIIYCYSDCAGVIDLSEYCTVTLLVKEGISISDEIIEKAKSECKILVNVKEIPADIYTEKLNLKLLGGDDDFDVFYVFSDSAGIKDYLKNSLFEPLNSYPVAEKFDLMFDGMRDFMSYDENIFGVPISVQYLFSLKTTDCFARMGFEPPSLYTDINKMFWYCDKLLESGEKNVSLFMEYEDLSFPMYFCLQDYINSGAKDKDGLKDVLSELKKYCDCGVLYGKGPIEEREYLFAGVPYYYESTCGTNRITYSENTLERISADDEIFFLMSPQGKNYISLKSYVSVNPKSENKEKAMQLLSLFVDSVLYDDNNYMNFCKRFADKYPDVYEMKSEKMKKCAYLTEKSFENASPFTVYYMDMYKCYGTALSKLLNGKISVDEALNEICGEIDYLYFE